MFLMERQKKALEAIAELGLAPEGERTAAQLAERLSLSRESVHQLLLPLVRAGLVAADRGRSGGYRLVPSAQTSSLLSVIVPYARDAARGETSDRSPAFIRRIDEEARRVCQGFFADITVRKLIDSARAEREALDYHI